MILADFYLAFVVLILMNVGALGAVYMKSGLAHLARQPGKRDLAVLYKHNPNSSHAKRASPASI